MPAMIDTCRSLNRDRSRQQLAWCGLGLLLGFATVATGNDGPAVERPNIVLILTDDQGYGDLSLHGNPHLRTPHIDRLGETGIRFDRFYVNSFCAPTRAAVLTGRYPLRCGVWGVTHNKECMRPEEVTLAEALQGAGYRTACFGKWHNGEQFPHTPLGQGFDDFFGFQNGHINNYFNPILIRGNRYESTAGYITDVLTDEALRFIERHQTEPFFCYLAFNAPHSPYQVPDRFYDRFRSLGFEESVSAFFGMCENIDDNVGRILTHLDELELAQRTMVIFLTDNGGTAGVPIYNAGMRGGKTSVHEGGCRVPFFLRWPDGFSEPCLIEQIASHIDLYPTILELCGLDLPAVPLVDGISLVPLLKQDASTWPERVIFTHNPISETNRYPGAVRTQRYRLVRTIPSPQGGSAARPNDHAARQWQLFDMPHDPGETLDLADELPEIVDELSRLYEDWMDDMHSVPVERLPIPVGYEQENPVRLNAPQAIPSGSLTFACGPGFAHDWLTDWSDPASRIEFDINVVRSGEYALSVQYACQAEDGGTRLRISAGRNTAEANLGVALAPTIALPHRDARGHERYIDRTWGIQDCGSLRLDAGRVRLIIESVQAAPTLEFKSIRLDRRRD